MATIVVVLVGLTVGGIAQPSSLGIGQGGSCLCGDPAQTMWFLGWLPYAVGHGLDPFRSSLQYAGAGGVNLLANTADFAQGLVLAPVTVAAGARDALAVGILVAPVVSGLAALWAARRVVPWLPGAVVAACVWACSPVVVGHAPFGHLNLAWAVGVPLLTGAAWSLPIGAPDRWARRGLVVATAVVVTFWVSTEQLVIAAVALGIAGLLALPSVLRQRAVSRAWLGRWLRPAGLGVAVSAALLGWPSWEALAGPRHTSGPPWANITRLAAAPGAPVDAGQHLMSRALAVVSGYGGVPGPALDYVGPVLAVMALGALLLVRDRVACVIAGTGAACWALSWGVQPAYWTPWRLLHRLPILERVTPDRFGEVTVWAVALLVGLGISRLATAGGAPLAGSEPARRGAGRSGARPWWWRSRQVAAGAVAAVALAGCVPLVAAEHVPDRVVRMGLPAWVAAARVPEGARVLVLPDPSSGVGGALAWQALGGFRMALLGGDALVPPDGRQSGPAVWSPPPASFDGIVDALSSPLAPLPDDDARTWRTLWAGLHRYGVQDVVVSPDPHEGPVPVAADFSPARALAAAVIVSKAVGAAPAWTSGAWVFRQVRHDPGPVASGG